MTTLALLTPPPGGMLIASSSPLLREELLRRFRNRRWPVAQAVGGADALVKLETGDWQVLYLDRRLPDLDAEELITIVHSRFPRIHVELLDSKVDTATDSAVDSRLDSDDSRRDAISPSEQRAFGFWSAPVSAKRAFDADDKSADLRPASIGASEIEPLPAMVGRSAGMQQLYRLTRLVAPRLTTVLIVGPTGTGKELVARALHLLSPRSSHSFVVVNCAAIPDALLESELFGYTRGAFTGAVQSYAGRIHAAQGGTLFLDEIGELPLGVQAKLLRFLDRKEVQRLGTADAIRVDVRVVAATNVDLGARVADGTFRADLYYRLSAFPLELPALNERRCDIQPLAEHFLQSMAAAARSIPMALSLEAVHALQTREWAGNVRELQQALERASILADGGLMILPEHLQVSPPRGPWLAGSNGAPRRQAQ